CPALCSHSCRSLKLCNRLLPTACPDVCDDDW
nr:Chain A, LH3 [synthetic construct]